MYIMVNERKINLNNISLFERNKYFILNCSKLQIMIDATIKKMNSKRKKMSREKKNDFNLF